MKLIVIHLNSNELRFITAIWFYYLTKQVALSI